MRSRIHKPRFRSVSIFAFALLTPFSVTAQQSQFNVAALDRARVLNAANQYLSEKPITITASHSPRSAGGLQDFFSEGDYWWPDPKNPDGPYIQRDDARRSCQGSSSRRVECTAHRGFSDRATNNLLRKRNPAIRLRCADCATR